MRSISVFFLFVFIVCSCSSIGQQSYASHRVEEGETASAIAAKYNITIYELYKLNPEARGNLYPGLVLVLPGGKAASVPAGDGEMQDDFIVHKVQKGETIYKLAQLYDVPEEVIKKFNTQLYTNELRTGEEIKIPKGYVATGETSETGKAAETNRKHIVKPKETKYGLATMYGVTISELEEMNPQIREGLKAGTIVNVPDKSYTQDAVIDEAAYNVYEVKPQETLYTLTRRWELSKEELTALNPSLKDGLKSGMVLKLPKDVGGIGVTEAEDASKLKVDLSQKLNNFSTKNIALLLPFNTSSTQGDSIEVKQNAIKKDRVMRIALDFYSGALMAVDSAKALGISTKLNVFDTEYQRRDGVSTNARKIQTLIARNDFNNLDAVIGPLTGGNVNQTASILRGQNIPVVSPITTRVEASSNLFQTRPTERILRDKMLDFISKNGSGKNIVIIADSKHADTKNKILNYFPSAKVISPRSGDDGLYLYGNDINSNIVSGQENWIILETNNIPLISNVVTNLTTQVRKNDVTLLTTYKGNAYDSDDITNYALMNLNFHFPSVDKEYDFENKSGFILAYEKKYGIVPNKYAVRGFDVTFDTLLRLASSEDLYASASENVITSYIENKFNYIKASSGFYNDAVFILKYGEDLKLEEVEVPTEVIDKFKDFKN